MATTKKNTRSARSASQNTRTNRRSSAKGSRRSSGGDSGIRASELVNELTNERSESRRSLKAFINSPIFGYIGGSLALAFVGRFMFRYYQGHPEISDFFRGSLDNVETRMRSMNGFRGFRGSDSIDMDARH